MPEAIELKQNMKKLKRIALASALAVACMELLGCSPATSSANPSTPKADSHATVAQAYFRLGVSVAQNVILQHELAGTPVPTGAQMLAECKEYDRTHGGDKDTLLQAP